MPWSPRSHKTQVLDSYVYSDVDDLFAREPFVAQFSLPSKGRRGRVSLLRGSGKGVWLALLGAWSPRGWVEQSQGWKGTLHIWGLAVLPRLVLVPLHTTPKAVGEELNALYDVFLDVSQHWNIKVGLARLHGTDGDRMAGRPGPTAFPLCRT